MPRVVAHDDPEAPVLVEDALERGETLVFPTDTIYGIGGDPWDTRTVRRVRQLKSRPHDQPFALLLATVAHVDRYARLGTGERRWIDRLLPGPYTFLLPAGRGAPPVAAASGVIGLRVPDHPFFDRLLARLDRPLFGTSVNRRGEPPLIDIDRIIDRFPSVELIVTGPTSGQPSAILDLTTTPPRVVRGELPPATLDLLEKE